jgi:hypothetical protein
MDDLFAQNQRSDKLTKLGDSLIGLAALAFTLSDKYGDKRGPWEAHEVFGLRAFYHTGFAKTLARCGLIANEL